MPAGVSALKALANITLTGTQSSVTFSSISGLYRDLVLVGDFVSGTTGYFGIRVNGDSANNYVWIQMNGNGSSVGNSQAPTASSYGLNNGSTSSTTDYMPFTFTLLDYSATDKHKSGIVRIGRSGGSTELLMGRWANTSAITSLVVYGAGSANFAAGSSFALYGVSA